VERVHRGVTEASNSVTDTRTEARQDRAPARGRTSTRRAGAALAPYLQAAPMALVFLLFFVLPLAATIVVSFWQYTHYSIEPAFTLQNYGDIFSGCIRDLPELCTTFRTYISTLKFGLIVWATTLVTGFTVAYFLAFHVRTLKVQVIFFLLCTVPFWTSIVIRMISWIPLLGRNGLVNQTLMSMGVIDTPLEGLLYSDFAVILAMTHLYTLFMVVPIFNSLMRIDRDLIEAARDAGASGFQTLTVIIIPLGRPGILIGSIFVVTIVMGDFLTIGIMGGQQIASVGKVIQTQMQFLQFPLAAANAVILLAAVLVGVWALLKLVDIRKEL
jgi:putative spermidine/putrescine transport system permease protein